MGTVGTGGWRRVANQAHLAQAATLPSPAIGRQRHAVPRQRGKYRVPGRRRKGPGTGVAGRKHIEVAQGPPARRNEFGQAQARHQQP